MEEKQKKDIQKTDEKKREAQKKKNAEKRRKQRNRRLAFGCMILLIVVLLGLLAWTSKRSGDKDPEQNEGNTNVENNTGNNSEGEGNAEPEGDNNGGETTPPPTELPAPSVDINIDALDSTAVVLIRREDNAVLCEKDADTKLFPASMTKIMTAIVAIEKITDMQQTLKIKQTSYDRVYLEGASLAGFPCGKDIPIIDVLYGVILPSGADACVGIAEHLYGTEAEMVKDMNAKAAELGMTGTNFMNTTGLHHEEHYTTLKDLAVLVQYALQNETFKTIYSAKTYTTSPVGSYTEGLTFRNTMFARLGQSKIENGEILGGKTGFTDEAGHCLASYAVVNGTEYILVTGGSMDESKMGAVRDAIKIYNQLS